MTSKRQLRAQVASLKGALDGMMRFNKKCMADLDEMAEQLASLPQPPHPAACSSLAACIRMCHRAQSAEQMLDDLMAAPEPSEIAEQP